jgi:TolB protein
MFLRVAAAGSAATARLPYSTSGQQGKIALSVFISSKWQIFRVSPGEQKATPQADNFQDLHYPAWSPDGDRLAYATDDGKIKIVTPGQVPSSINNLPGHCTHPAWSPDGAQLVCTCYEFSGGKEDSDLWLINLKQKQTRRLLAQPGLQKHPAWSPDGTTIAYTSGYRRDYQIIEQIWMTDIEGQNPRRLVAGDGSELQPAWSPDGSRLAFASNRNGNMDIWVADRDGRNLTVLTHSYAYDADPSWSPDGTSICFISTRSGNLKPWIIEVKTGRVFQIPAFVNSAVRAKEPHWSR